MCCPMEQIWPKIGEYLGRFCSGQHIIKSKMSSIMLINIEISFLEGQTSLPLGVHSVV